MKMVITAGLGCGLGSIKGNLKVGGEEIYIRLVERGRGLEIENRGQMMILFGEKKMGGWREKGSICRSSSSSSSSSIRGIERKRR